jgi:hypothetical protein
MKYDIIEYSGKGGERMKKKIVILGFTRQEYAIIMLALRNVLTHVNPEQQDEALSLMDRLYTKIDCFVDSEEFYKESKPCQKEEND